MFVEEERLVGEGVETMEFYPRPCPSSVSLRIRTVKEGRSRMHESDRYHPQIPRGKGLGALLVRDATRLVQSRAERDQLSIQPADVTRRLGRDGAVAACLC